MVMFLPRIAGSLRDQMARRRALSKMGLQELDKTQIEFMAFPLIVRGNHWILLLLQPQDRRILVVDSLTK
eukprot:3842318-Rhodomonas_salina.1